MRESIFENSINEIIMVIFLSFLVPEMKEFIDTIREMEILEYLLIYLMEQIRV